MQQAETAAAGCLKGTKILFGLAEWSDYSESCGMWTAAIVAEAASGRAETMEIAEWYRARADELMARAMSLPYLP